MLAFNLNLEYSLEALALESTDFLGEGGSFSTELTLIFGLEIAELGGFLNSAKGRSLLATEILLSLSVLGWHFHYTGLKFSLDNCQNLSSLTQTTLDIHLFPCCRTLFLVLYVLISLPLASIIASQDTS